MKFIISLLFISATGIATLSACSMAGYQKIEEMSLPRYQKGTPVMSDMKVMCRAQVIVKPESDPPYLGGPNFTHPPLDFMVTYDDIWDVTTYPTPPRLPQKYNPKWCQNGIATQVINRSGLGTLFTKLKTNHLEPDRYNWDPSNGAVRVWKLPSVRMDGLNYLATMVGFMPMIIEGDKLPTASNFSNGKFTTDPRTKKETITINGREWQHMKWSIIFGRSDPAQEKYNVPGASSGVDELYITKVGNHMFAVVAWYSGDLATHAPDWLAKRQEFLRHWLESFKFEPIPPSVK